MAVTTHAQAAVDKSVIARILCAERHHSLLQEYQTLRGLEGGTGRIGALQRTVEQRFVGIVDQRTIPLSTLSADKSRGVVGRRRHHR